MPPNLLADYLYLWETTAVRQAIETARTSVSSGDSSSYWCQQVPTFPNARYLFALLAFDRIAERWLLAEDGAEDKISDQGVELGSATLELGGECPR